MQSPFPAPQKVLMVEDQASVRKFIREVLQRDGLTLLEAATAAEAEAIIQGERPDLLLLDRILPDDDGCELLRRLRQRPELDHLSTIILSSRGEEEDLVEALEAGAVDYLTKPVSPTILRARVEAALSSVLNRRELIAARRAAEAASMVKTQFLTNVSHELRTPMTAILGFAEIMADSEILREDEICLEGLETIRRNGHWLVGLIDDLLLLSSLEFHRVHLTTAACSSQEILNELGEYFDRIVGAKPLQFSSDLGSQVPSVLQCDARYLTLVLRKLVDNAVRFSAAGKLHFSMRPEIAGRQPVVSFQISDMGCGISPDDLPRLAEPFSQGDSSLTRDHSGMGMGLTIAHRVASLMHGHLCFHSIPHVGTTTTLWVPLEAAASEQRRGKPISCPHHRAVLIDSHLVRTVSLQRDLLRRHFDVVILQSPVDCLRLVAEAHAAQRDYDVICVDGNSIDPEVEGLLATLLARGCRTPLAKIFPGGMLEWMEGSHVNASMAAEMRAALGDSSSLGSRPN